VEISWAGSGLVEIPKQVCQVLCNNKQQWLSCRGRGNCSTHARHASCCNNSSLPACNLPESPDLSASRWLSGALWGVDGRGSEGPSKVKESGMSDVRVGGGAHTHRSHTCLPWPLPNLHNLPISPHISGSRGVLGALRERPRRDSNYSM
jgi:hypothetical protein